MALTIGVDIGGTKIAAGVVDPDGRVIDEARESTPATDTAAVEETVATVVRTLTDKHDVAAVGVAAAGFIDAERSTVLFAPNLAWRDEPLRAEIEKRIDLPVVVENDANAAAWGEYTFGAGEDAQDLLMVALGTGIGGGIVMGGELFRGTYGIAAEFGHIRAVPDGEFCGCGKRGCWEQYASGTSLVRYVRNALESDPQASPALLAACDGDPSSLTGQMITEAAVAGDALALEAFDDLARWLGEGLSDLVSVFDPGVIVIGGGVSEAGDTLLKPARAAFRGLLSGGQYRPEAELRLASLGNQAGLIGVADLARDRVRND